MLFGFFRRFVFSFNIAAAVLLAASFFSTSISPAESWVFALFGLAYPYLLLINLFFAIFWLLQFNLRALLSIGMMVAGYPHFRQSFSFGRDTGATKDAVSIVSYNAGLFGFYQSRWHTGEMIAKVKDVSPSVLCVQEFLNIGDKGSTTADSIAEACGFKYHVFRRLNDGRKKGAYGMAVFSKYPLLAADLVHFDGLTGNMCIYADMEANGRRIRVYNVHLQSFKFRKQDYSFLVKMPDNNHEKVIQSRSILKRMKEAYVKRSEQVEAIVSHMQSSEFPIMLCGDFNDPPVSYSYAQLSQGMKDAFLENGRGMGKTYIGAMPNFRIDYILYPAACTGLFYRTFRLSSDHSMLSAGFRFEKD